MTIEATSEPQLAAARDRSGAPPLERVRDDVWALGMTMPGGSRYLQASLGYILTDATGGVHIIDPGWDTPANRTAIESALAALGRTYSDIATIVATHFHPDHSGLTGFLHGASGAPIAMHAFDRDAIARFGRARDERADLVAELDSWGVPIENRVELLSGGDRSESPQIEEPTLLVDDGDRLDAPGLQLRVIHTPGHSDGSICIRDEARGLMFTGDHVVPTLHPGVGVGTSGQTNPLADYLDSLSRMLPFDHDEVLPGHGYRFRGLADRAAQTARHHLRRTGEVDAALALDPSLTTWQLASRLSWTAGWANLRQWFVVSALRQTEMHARLVRASDYARLAREWRDR